MMTEEIIKSITDAEAQAAAIKRTASERAAQIIAQAEAQATQTERVSADVCKAYVDSQTKAAQAEAEKRYNETLATESKTARAYCAKVLEGAEDCVSKIVGRIVDGDC